MIRNETGRLADRFPRELLDNVMLLPKDVSPLVLLVLQSMYDLTFNAYYTLNSSEAQEKLWSDSGERTVESLLMGARRSEYDGDKVYDDLQNSINSTVEAAKTDAHSKYPSKKVQPGQALSKKSVFDSTELLYTEDMIKYIIYTLIENAPGPIDFSEELIAFNTFDGYEHDRDYDKNPPRSPDEQEIADGVRDLLQRFSFKDKPMSADIRNRYLDDCCMFINLIFNYVVRELEICDTLIPLGHVEYPDKPEMTKLYLLNMQYGPDDPVTGFSKIMSYGALSHKSVLKAGNDIYTPAFGKYIILTEITDYKLNKSTGADVYIHCILFAEKLESESVDIRSLGAYTFEGLPYYKVHELQLELDYVTYLQLFLNTNYNKYLENIMNVMLAHSMSRGDINIADKKAVDVIKTLLTITDDGGRDGNGDNQ